MARSLERQRRSTDFGVDGLRFALESRKGRNATPVRSAMLGAVLAVTVLTAALTFGASLNSLVSRPALYGWNWNYALLASFAGAEDMLPAHRERTGVLEHDTDIPSWTGIYLVATKLDGQNVGMVTEAPNATIAPPILTGHGLKTADQIRRRLIDPRDTP